MNRDQTHTIKRAGATVTSATVTQIPVDYDAEASAVWLAALAVRTGKDHEKDHRKASDPIAAALRTAHANGRAQRQRQDAEIAEMITTIRGHAWLERFRKAGSGNRFNEMSSLAANDIARYVDEFLDRVAKLIEDTP